MSKDNLEYFVEVLGNGKTEPITGSFNLWEREGNKFYNRATLFLNDRLCGCQWDVSDRQRAVSYDNQEIKDELENPLKQISPEVANHLIDMRDKTYKDVFEYLELVSQEQGDFAGLKYIRKSGETKHA